MARRIIPFGEMREGQVGVSEATGLTYLKGNPKEGYTAIASSSGKGYEDAKPNPNQPMIVEDEDGSAE